MVHFEAYLNLQHAAVRSPLLDGHLQGLDAQQSCREASSHAGADDEHDDADDIGQHAFDLEHVPVGVVLEGGVGDDDALNLDSDGRAR